MILGPVVDSLGLRGCKTAAWRRPQGICMCEPRAQEQGLCGMYVRAGVIGV